MTNLVLTEPTTVQLASKQGTYEAVIASPQNPILTGREMSFERYRKNPVVCFAHEHKNIPIGRTVALWRDDRGLVAEFDFLKDDSVADRVKNAWEQGVLKASSLGVLIHADQSTELLEWSIVAIGADPDAVIRSIIDGPKKEVHTSKQMELLVATPEHLDLTAPISSTKDVKLSTGVDPIAKCGFDVETDIPPGHVREWALARAALLKDLDFLLPASIDPATLSNVELLRVALRDFVIDANDRDESFLRGALEQVLAHRTTSGVRSNVDHLVHSMNHVPTSLLDLRTRERTR